jgi:hypothetical protein
VAFDIFALRLVKISTSITEVQPSTVHARFERKRARDANAGRNVSDKTILPGKYGIRVRVDGDTTWSPFTNFTMGGQCR